MFKIAGAPDFKKDSKNNAETEADIDPKIDAAVDDIMKRDGDDALEVQDKAAESAVVVKRTFRERIKNFLADLWADPRKRWWTIGCAVVAVAVLAAVPVTRYNIVGLVLKAPVTVQVVDSKTGAPVSGATVKVGTKTALTEGDGKAVLRVHAGTRSVKVTKKYYTSASKHELVALSGGSNTFKVSVVALGRQVSIKLVDKISDKPLAGVLISSQGAKAKTDAKGLATLVIGSSATTQSADISLSGYNTAKVNVTAGADLAKNTFGITPSGKLYFLSNLTGSIDVVKTNLDGTDRQTVLAGTGSEDRNNTSLLVSRDWKYLALLSKRAGGDNASVYLIDTTSDDKLTTIDEGNANFSLVGWSGDRFIYEVDRSSTVQLWQQNRFALKSFDPTSGHTMTLDQTAGDGSSGNNYVNQNFGLIYLVEDQIVYAKNWSGWGLNVLDGKSAELDTIRADGSGHQVLKTFPYVNSGYAYGYTSASIDTRLYEPNSIYIEANNNGSNPTFYDYEDGKVTTDTTLSQDQFWSTPYPTYLLSPSSNQTFWTDQRDGKNTLFVGDNDAKNQKTIASLSGYNIYGWFTDNYLLVSKNSSELYVMPVAGGTPLKITDYYKPAINYQSYGGGYGGL